VEVAGEVQVPTLPALKGAGAARMEVAAQKAADAANIREDMAELYELSIRGLPVNGPPLVLHLNLEV